MLFGVKASAKLMAPSLRTHLAKSVDAVSGPRILYSIFAPWILPTFDKRYWVVVAYAIRMLGLNNQIYNRNETLAVGSG